MANNGHSSFSGLSSMLDHPSVQPEPNSGCWLWTGARTSDGYGVMSVKGGARHLLVRLHRHSWVLENGRPIPEDRIICHKCNIRICVNPDHLYAGTDKDNHEDAKRCGNFWTFGSRTNNAKLREIDIPQIKSLYAKGLEQKDIAKQFGVSVPTVSMIVTGKTWKHVQ